MGYRFSRISKQRLQGINPDLQRIARLALQLKDFKILEGKRSEQTQEEYVRRGVSQTMNSRHLDEPYANAFDWIPCIGGRPIDWIPGEITARDKLVAEWAYMAGIFAGIALVLGIPARNGLDWNRDGNITDTRFHDWGHTELPKGWTTVEPTRGEAFP